MPSKKTEIKPAAKSASKPAVPSIKKLIAQINDNQGPRGLKVAKNDVGAYAFTYGPKSAPIAIVASSDELVGILLRFLGLKLS
jgi:hypothetical protein